MALAPLALNNCCPLSVLELKGRPRTVTPVPSIWNAVFPPLAETKREIDTPDTRWRTSVIELSGSLPASSATIESTIVSAFFLISMALCSALRRVVTTISDTVSTTWLFLAEDDASCVADLSCAATGAASAHRAPSEAPATSRWRARIELFTFIPSPRVSIGADQSPTPGRRSGIFLTGSAMIDGLKAFPKLLFLLCYLSPSPRTVR